MSQPDNRLYGRFDDHFDEMTGLLYLEGQLDPDRARNVSAHVAACGSCRELLSALEKEAVWLEEALVSDEESLPAHLLAEPKRGTTGWGWVLAFGLGVGGAYTLWTGWIEPSLTQAAQAGFTQGNILTMIFFTGAFWKGWDAMRNLPEFLAGATLAAVAIWLLRKHWQRFTTIAFVLSAIACVLALPLSAGAAGVRHGDPNYTLPAGQEVNNDLIVAAVRTRIDGDVDGDLIVWSESVTVNGHVKGDILCVARQLRVNGTVDGNVRAWVQDLSLEGTIGKNVSTWTGEADLDEKATIGGSMASFSGATELDGHIGGDLLAASLGDININGTLDRDATIRAERLSLGPTAEIKGHTKYQGYRQPEVSPSAQLGSPIEVTIKGPGPDYASPSYYWHQTLYWGASFLFGLVLLFLAPGFFFDVVQECKRVWPALGFGVLFLFATPIVLAIVCATIVGLGVGISAVLLYLIAVYAVQVFVGSWLGEKLLGPGVGVGLAVGRLAVGLAILRVLRMIPYAGPFVGSIIVTWGLGALVLALHKRIRPQLAPAP
jgi:cytoskeletal protein CcmA (bactofilin family)